MQPAPPDVSNRSHTVNRSPDDFQNTQHGHDFYGDSQVSGRLPWGAGDTPVGSDSSADELSLLNTESSSAIDRVSEYENKYRSQSDFGFIVIPSTKESKLSFDAFPNGVFVQSPVLIQSCA